MDSTKKEKRLKLILNIGFINGLLWISLFLLFILKILFINSSKFSCEYKIYARQNLMIYNKYSHPNTTGSCPILEKNNFILKNAIMIEQL